MGIYKITEKQRQEMFETFKETLARYKFDWNALRTVMVATGAVISGSTALAILLRGEFVPQDLDIYVDAEGFTTMLVFLMNHWVPGRHRTTLRTQQDISRIKKHYDPQV